MTTLGQILFRATHTYPKESKKKVIGESPQKSGRPSVDLSLKTIIKVLVLCSRCCTTIVSILLTLNNFNPHTNILGN